MTKWIIPTILAGAIGIAGGYAAHTEGSDALAPTIAGYLQGPTKRHPVMTLKEAMNAFTKENKGGSLESYLGPTIDPPQYIPEKIDRVEFVYQTARARDIFHQGLQLFLDQYPYSDELGERIYRMRQLEKFFYSTQFGIKDPEWTGGYIAGTPVMDEERAQRILDYANAHFGWGRPQESCAYDSLANRTLSEEDPPTVDSLLRPLSPQPRPGPIQRFKPRTQQRDGSSPSSRTYGDWLGRGPTNNHQTSAQASSFWSARPIR